MAHYLDTSALVKLVVHEKETEPLRAWLRASDRQPVTCDLSRTELMRAVRRAAPERAVAARNVLDGLTIRRVDTALFDAAGRIDPPELRSLDALHLAAAVDLGDDLDALVTYDDRLAAAARANAIDVLAPA